MTWWVCCHSVPCVEVNISSTISSTRCLSLYSIYILHVWIVLEEQWLMSSGYEITSGARVFSKLYRTMTYEMHATVKSEQVWNRLFAVRETARYICRLTPVHCASNTYLLYRVNQPQSLIVWAGAPQFYNNSTRSSVRNTSRSNFAALRRRHVVFINAHGMPIDRSPKSTF